MWLLAYVPHGVDLVSRGSGIPESPRDWLILAGIFVAMAVAYALYSIIDERREQAYHRFWRERGFRFAPLRDGEEKRHVAACPLFDLGSDGLWGVTFSGLHDRVPFVAFEYQWNEISLLSSAGKTRRIAGMIWTLPRDLPQFVLTAQGLWKWWVLPAGPPRIAFDPSERFARHHWLQASDEGAVRSLFTSEIRTFFAVHPSECVSAAGRELMWWRRGRLPRSASLDAFLADGERIRTLLAPGVNG